MWQYDDIAVLTMVAESGSFSAAARKLAMPTSTVSRRVKQLEDALGLRLIERSSRKMNLTDQGLYLVNHCSSPVQQIRESVDGVVQRQRSSQGRLRVTAPVFLSVEVLGRWFAEFAQKQPQIQLDLQLNNDVEDLIEMNFDLAIRVGPLKDSQFIAQYLHSCCYQLCASPKYVELHSQVCKLDDLRQHRYLSLDKNIKLTVSDNHFTFNLNELDAVYTSNDIAVLRDACLAGMGISCLPDFAIQKNIDQGELVPVLPQYEISPKRDIYAVYPSRRHLAPTTRQCIEFLRGKYLAL